jgi:hypothetical protein
MPGVSGSNPLIIIMDLTKYKFQIDHHKVIFFLVIGSKSEFQARKIKTFDFWAQIPKSMFHLRRDWELKDCIIYGLPNNFRFLLLTDYEVVESVKGQFYILFVRR